jgi:hypothetical protein
MKPVTNPYKSQATEVLQSLYNDAQARIKEDNSKPRSAEFWKMVEISTSIKSELDLREIDRKKSEIRE